MRIIDADILKKEVKTMFCPDGYKIMMLERIDNTPELGYEDGVLLVENVTRRAIELEEAYNNGWSDGFNEVENERPKGEWLHPYTTNIACECSNCHMQMPITDYFNFCPNCGAYMKGEDNDK